MNKVLQWSIASTVVILLCMASYSYADIPAARWFHLFEHTRLYELFGLITLLGDSIVYLFGGILLFILFRHKNRYRTYIGLFLFTAVATSGLTADLVKCIAGRARPVLCFNENLYGFAFFQTEKVWTSFPRPFSDRTECCHASCHALPSMEGCLHFYRISGGIQPNFSGATLHKRCYCRLFSGHCHNRSSLYLFF